MRMSDWSSDVCSSDLRVRTQQRFALAVSAIAPVVERAPRSRECIVYVFAIGGTALPQRIAGCRIEERKSVVLGKSVSVRVDLGGRRVIKKKKITQRT